MTVEHVTDNGACYNFSPSGTRAGRLGLNYTRAKPYTPKNTGEAERLILREWAHAHAYNIIKGTRRRICHDGCTATIGIRWQFEIRKPDRPLWPLLRRSMPSTSLA